MGMRLDVTAGGGKGFSSSRVSAKWCILLYLFLILFSFGIRCAQDRMVVTRAEVFNVYGFQYQKNT